MKIRRLALAGALLAAAIVPALAGIYTDTLTVTGASTFGTPWSATITKPNGPSPTGSTAGVMMGLAGAITPVSSGRVLLMITGDTTNNTANDGTSVQCAYGTGTAPTNGASAAGTNLGNPVHFINANSTTAKAPFTCQGFFTGATVGTGIWLDVNLAAITGGSATVADVTITAIEF